MPTRTAVSSGALSKQRETADSEEGLRRDLRGGGRALGSGISGTGDVEDDPDRGVCGARLTPLEARITLEPEPERAG